MRIAFILITGLALTSACESSGTGTIAIAGGTAANHLVFTVPPTGPSAAGAAITPAVVVRAALASGAVDTSFRGIITMAIGAGSTGTGTLSGGGGVVASAGVATFGGLTISAAGDYTLTASSPPLVGITSAHFAITP